MEINLQYQFLAFANYEDITPTRDIIKYFIDVFEDKNFLPSQSPSIEYEIKTGDIKKIDRLQLTSPDNMWAIRFDKDRLDIRCVREAVDNESKFISIIDFIEEAKEIFSRINEKFPKTSKRLGLKVKSLIDKKYLNESKIDEKLRNKIKFFENIPPVELRNKFVGRKTIDIKRTEIVNISSELSYGKGSLMNGFIKTSFDGMLFNIDINTLHEADESRFGKEETDLFLDQANNLQNQILQEYYNLFKLQNG